MLLEQFLCAPMIPILDNVGVNLLSLVSIAQNAKTVIGDLERTANLVVKVSLNFKTLLWKVKNPKANSPDHYIV